MSTQIWTKDLGTEPEVAIKKLNLTADQRPVIWVAAQNPAHVQWRSHIKELFTRWYERYDHDPQRVQDQYDAYIKRYPVPPIYTTEYPPLPVLFIISSAQSVQGQS